MRIIVRHPFHSYADSIEYRPDLALRSFQYAISDTGIVVCPQLYREAWFNRLGRYNCGELWKGGDEQQAELETHGFLLWWLKRKPPRKPPIDGFFILGT